MAGSIDRNAADFARIRRNFQRMRDAQVANGTAVWMETPAGTINGANAVFTLAHSPVAGTLMLYVNGLLMLEGGDYSLSGGTVTFVTAAKPETGDWIRATYSRI